MMYIALGGALGASVRFVCSAYIGAIYVGKLPIGTFFVNVTGSLLIGVIFVLLTEKGLIHQDLKNFLVVGLLGSFTTYSTFSLDAFHLFEMGQYPLAAVYVLSTTIVCLLGVFSGIYLTRALL